MVTASRSRAKILGHTEPRIFTQPLRELTPKTTYGYDVIDFARKQLKQPLDPWQEWLVVHAGELLPNGAPRFRQVLVLVARQNGKTHLLVILSLYWLYKTRVQMVLGTSTNLAYALESWDKARQIIENNDALFRDVARIRLANGEQVITLLGGARYKIAASNSRGGRGLTVDRLIMDELREHHDWSAYDAAVPATSAVKDAQTWMISNQGDDSSEVLISLRKTALSTPKGRLGLFEWSGPDGAEATDIEALAMANPNLGRRKDVDSLLDDARRASLPGGNLTGFLTEHQCRYVPQLNPAVDPRAWLDCQTGGDLSAARDRVALCLDVSTDLLHAALYAAAVMDDGTARVDMVRNWAGEACTDELRKQLVEIVLHVKPRVLGWFPTGPAAALAADLRQKSNWPPRGVEIQEIRGDASAVCMGFSELVSAKRISHAGNRDLDIQIFDAEKVSFGDGWRFSRKEGPVDALYACAGAVHLARTLPAPRPRPFVYVAPP